MARPLRVQFENALYHLCARGIRRSEIFASDSDYIRFEHFLAESLQRYQVELHCYVLLPNHFHLLARTLKPNLSQWMHWLISTYSIWFNRRHQLSGHVFQGRYGAFLVQEGNYLLELSRYLHLNPVRGHVLGAGNPNKHRTRLRSYQWGSYRGYAGLVRQRQFVIEDLVLGEFTGGRGRRKMKGQYRRFVEEGLLREIANPFEQVRWQSALGDESFIRQLNDRLISMGVEERDPTNVPRALQSNRPAELIDRVAKHYRIPPRKLFEKGGYGSEARNVAMWLLRRKGTLTLREIGLLFGGIDYAAVSQRIRRLDREIAKREQLRQTCEMLNV